MPVPDFLKGTRQADTIDPVESIHLLLVGGPSSGKTNLALTAEGPIYWADFDNKPQSGSFNPAIKREEVTVKTYFDAQQKGAHAFKDFTQDLGMFEYLKLSGKDLYFKTIVLDSLTYMSRAAMNMYFTENSGNKNVLKMTLGGQESYVARGYEPYDAETNSLISSISRCFALGINVIVTAHERKEEAPDSTQETPKFTGKYAVDPPRMHKVMALFPEKWRIKAINATTYKVNTKPDFEFSGGTNLSIDAVENANIREIIAKHRTNAKRVVTPALVGK